MNVYFSLRVNTLMCFYCTLCLETMIKPINVMPCYVDCDCHVRWRKALFTLSFILYRLAAYSFVQSIRFATTTNAKLHIVRCISLRTVYKCSFSANFTTVDVYIPFVCCSNACPFLFVCLFPLVLHVHLYLFNLPLLHSAFAIYYRKWIFVCSVPHTLQQFLFTLYSVLRAIRVMQIFFLGSIKNIQLISQYFVWQESVCNSTEIHILFFRWVVRVRPKVRERERNRSILNSNHAFRFFSFVRSSFRCYRFVTVHIE